MTTLHLFREAVSEDTYAATDLDAAKAMLAKAAGEEEAKECNDWESIPDTKVLTVDCEGIKVTKTVMEWANDEPIPGVVFSANY